MEEIRPSVCEAQVRRSLRLYVACLGALWAVALLVLWIQPNMFGRAYPYDTLLFNPNDRFTDFTIFYPRLVTYGRPEEFFSPSWYPFTYPAPLLLCYLVIGRFVEWPLAAYLGLVCIFACSTALVAIRRLPRGRSLRRFASVALISATVFSFPLLYLLDRANVEGLVWIAAAAGLYCFAKRYYYSTAVFLALATSMKLFPGVLLLLLLAKRRYREFAASVVFTAAFTVASLWAIGPSIPRANSSVAMGLDFFKRLQILRIHPSEIGFDHSLFSSVKLVAFGFMPDVARVNAALPEIYVAYGVGVVILFAAIYFLRLRKMPVLNQVLALSALSVTLPYTSYEYTLVHLAVPFIFVVYFLTGDVAPGFAPLEMRQILALVLPFFIIFGPTSFLFHLPIVQDPREDIGFGGQVKTMALIYLIAVALRLRLPSTLFEELGTRTT